MSMSTGFFIFLKNSMNIETLTFAHCDDFYREYTRCFESLSLPYGQILASNFLEKRLFSSELYATDCSKILITASGQVCGFLLANTRKNARQHESTALYLHLLFIFPEFQRQGYGKKTLAFLRDHAKHHQLSHIETALQWGGIWPGIPQSLQSAIAFSQHTQAHLNTGELFLELSLTEFCPPISLCLTEGYAVRFYQCTDKYALRSFLITHFSIGWMTEVMSKVDNTVETFNGYGLSETFNPNDILLITYQAQICGFCIVQSHTESDMAFFGPIGLSPMHRGRGMGDVIMTKIVDYLKSIPKLRIGLWTNEVIYEKFYKKYGFKKTYETCHAVWNV
jgi:GNAT superfamily N-acetyltransferase